MIQKLISLFKNKPTHFPDTSHSNVARETDFTNPEPIFELFTSLTGMHFHKKEAITAEKLKNFAVRHHIDSFASLRDELGRNDQMMQHLVDFLTVNETYFYRELEQVDILKRFIKERGEKRVRILCAPCASGEEVYSIIIRLLEGGIAPETFEVTGIDINSEAIARSKEGLYSKRSVNRLDDSLKEHYFSQKENRYEVKSNVKEPARFYQLNIFDTAFKELGKFDYIFSRNLFIYFDDQTKDRAINTFCDMLKERGTLFFGHADIFKEPECLSSGIIGKSRVYTKVS